MFNPSHARFAAPSIFQSAISRQHEGAPQLAGDKQMVKCKEKLICLALVMMNTRLYRCCSHCALIVATCEESGNRLEDACFTELQRTVTSKQELD